MYALPDPNLPTEQVPEAELDSKARETPAGLWSYYPTAPEDHGQGQLHEQLGSHGEQQEPEPRGLDDRRTAAIYVG